MMICTDDTYGHKISVLQHEGEIRESVLPHAENPQILPPIDLHTGAKDAPIHHSHLVELIRLTALYQKGQKILGKFDRKFRLKANANAGKSDLKFS
jgi:hypothetical protein